MYGSRTRRFCQVAGGSLIVAASALASVPGGTGSASAAGSSGLTFSRQVVVDQQRPGFEPDIKVSPHTGNIFSSVPFGFSTTQSFIWSSRDSGNSYQLTPGNLAGKPTTCVGGGDTDLLLDPGGELYFSDLQGLTNISVSKSPDEGATFSTNCLGAPNLPVDRMWFTSTGSLAGGDLSLYQDYDAVANALPSTNNQLVETYSSDGITFTPVINQNLSTDCAGGAFANCVTSDEGISGNQVALGNNLFISHTNATIPTSQARVSEGAVSAGVTPVTKQATWTESPALDGPLCPHPTCIDGSGSPEALAGENFASIAADATGHLYVTFTFARVNSSGTQIGPEAIYVVHSLQAATMADPSTVTWSAPVKISDNQTTVGTNIFPWITAGSDGRVDVAWYHTDEVSEGGVFGAGTLNHAEWTVELGQSINALAATPSYSVSTVTEHPIKYGQICTNGLGCTTGGDRSLGDFLQVTTDAQGAALVSYVDDTSADTAAGENAGPTEVSRQISGPSLQSGVGTVGGTGSGPGTAVDRVSDPTGDAFFSSAGTYTPAGDNLDLTGASLTDGPNNTLVGTISVKSLSGLGVGLAQGGPDASWILRWTQVTPGQTGNGHIYYAGMDNSGAGSGTPSFFVGDTSCVPGPGNPADHCKYLTYPQTTALTAAQGSYDPTTGVITFNIPRAEVGNPAVGTPLYSVTAFSATALVPQSATTLFNLTDAATPFDHTVATVSATGSGNGSGSGSGGGGGAPVPATGAMPNGGVVAGLGVAGMLLFGAGMAGRRRRR